MVTVASRVSVGVSCGGVVVASVGGVCGVCVVVWEGDWCRGS